MPRRDLLCCTPQITPNTIAAMNPNDRSAASTFSRIVSSIVASFVRIGWQLAMVQKGPAPIRESYEAPGPLAKRKRYCAAEARSVCRRIRSKLYQTRPMGHRGVITLPKACRVVCFVPVQVGQKCITGML